MRFDTFVDKKSIHFKLDKDVHLALRAKLFKYNISMQELFDEFANLVVTDVPKARSIVESILNKRMKSVLSGEKKRKKKKREVFNEVDTDTLYNMINESED
jgi:hypothetical protein